MQRSFRGQPFCGGHDPDREEEEGDAPEKVDPPPEAPCHCPFASSREKRPEAHDYWNVEVPFANAAPAACDDRQLPAVMAGHHPSPFDPHARGHTLYPDPPHRRQHHEYQEGQPAVVKQRRDLREGWTEGLLQVLE